MTKLHTSLAVAMLLAGCGPKDNGNAPAQNTAIANAVAQIEQRAAQERQQSEVRLREQETRTSRWQVAATIAAGSAAFALIIGAILGSRARNDSGQ